MRAWFRRWREQRRRRCRITTETGGYFIGRRHCATHAWYWDNGKKRCPFEGDEPW